MTKYDIIISTLKPPWVKSVFLRSLGRRNAIVQKLFHKWLFEDLTKVEWLAFSSHRESTEDPQIYTALMASNIGIPKKIIRETLKRYSSLLLKDSKPPSYERHIGYRTLEVSIEVREKRYTPKKGIKYSGYKRHHNDHGSISTLVKELPEYLEPTFESDNMILVLNIMKEIKAGKPALQLNNIRIKL